MAVQRSGVLWTANGVQLCGSGGVQNGDQLPAITSDGSHGAIVTWWDNRSGNYNIYAQRVNASGSVVWITNGVALRNIAGSDALAPAIAPDGSNGAIVAWYDRGSGVYDIYAQRVNSAGAVQWTANGVALRNIAGTNAWAPTMASDGSGGAIVTWPDDRSGAGSDIYAQRVNSAGAAQWTPNGVRLRSGVSSDGDLPTIISSGSGGAIITWEDARSGPWDIYAQKITDSAATHSITVTQEDHGAITPAGVGGVVTVNDGAGQAFTITPDPNYRVADVQVDGSSIGPVNSYTFYNVMNDHTITASFVTNSLIYYLAEGSTAWGFSTYTAIENPNTSAVTARITYMDTAAGNAGKGIIKTRNLTLPASSQTVVNASDDLPFPMDFSTKVESLSGLPLGVDRTMTFFCYPQDESVFGAHNSVAASTPSKAWYLPEGSSAWGFSTWTLVQNPNATDATVKLTYMTESGPASFDKAVPANSRATFSMAADIGAKDASTQVSSNIPVIAERSMYAAAGAADRREGHCSIGATTPSKDFFLAEGTTAWGFETYILVQNPNNSEATVNLTYMTPGGPINKPAFTIPAESRKTIKANDQLPFQTDISTMVHSDKPIVAERAMYWAVSNMPGKGMTDSIGVPFPQMAWLLPSGGDTAGNDAETFTCVQNPNPGAVTVQVSYLTPNGTGNVTFKDEIPANSRHTYNMSDRIKGPASIMVVSQDGARPVIVERSMYCQGRVSGTDTIGAFSDPTNR